MAIDELAPAPRKLKCPRCGRVAFVDPHGGGVGMRCPSCGGVHLGPSDVQHVICHELGIDASALRANARPALDEEAAGRCSSCEAPLSVVELERVHVELCLRCGAGWLDPGELERLTHGRHLERAPPSELARAYLPKDLTPGLARKKVVVAEPTAWRSWGFGALGAAVAGVGFGVLVQSLAAALYASGVFLSGVVGGWLLTVPLWRRRVIVRRDRGTIHAKNLGVPSADAKLPIDAVKAIAVEPVFATGTTTQIVAWQVVPRLHDGREVRWFMAVDRVAVHRLAFQLSQVLEVQVETPPGDEDA